MLGLYNGVFSGLLAHLIAQEVAGLGCGQADGRIPVAAPPRVAYFGASVTPMQRSKLFLASNYANRETLGYVDIRFPLLMLHEVKTLPPNR